MGKQYPSVYFLLLLYNFVHFRVAAGTTGKSPGTFFRTLHTVVTLSHPVYGDRGLGHKSVEVLKPDDIETNYPFEFLRDDRFNLAKRKAHFLKAYPCSGMEIVSLFLESSQLFYSDKVGIMDGDVHWVTCGRGVARQLYHGLSGKGRVVQLGIRLPTEDDDAEPRVQQIKKVEVATRCVRCTEFYMSVCVEVKIYAGRSGGDISRTVTHGSMTMLDFLFQPGGTVDQELLPELKGFLYVINGSVQVLQENNAHLALVAKGQVGSILTLEEDPQLEGNGRNVPKRKQTRFSGMGTGLITNTTLRLRGGNGGGRAILYVGLPKKRIFDFSETDI